MCMCVCSVCVRVCMHVCACVLCAHMHAPVYLHTKTHTCRKRHTPLTVHQHLVSFWGLFVGLLSGIHGIGQTIHLMGAGE